MTWELDVLPSLRAQIVVKTTCSVNTKITSLVVALHSVYGDHVLSDDLDMCFNIIIKSFDEEYTNAQAALVSWLLNIPALRPRFFDIAAEKIASGISAEDEALHNLALRYLDLLIQLAIDTQISLPMEICSISWKLLYSFDEQIADRASRLLLVGLDRCEKLTDATSEWTCICKAIKASHPTAGYRSWLALAKSRRQKPAFQQLLSKNIYWETLQAGIAKGSLVYECTKMCTKILEYSLDSIDVDLELADMIWVKEREPAFLNTWSRYFALIEILCLDTSINQTQDSVQDVLSILDPSSVIPPSWGIVLLEAAMTSNMDAIKRFISYTILGLHSNDMYVFNHGVPFVANQLLPYVLQAHHFTVTDSEECPHAKRVELFVGNLLEVLDVDQARNLVFEIMVQFHAARYSFEANRLVVVKALGEFLPQILTLRELEKVVAVGVAALQTFKSEVMGKLLFGSCVTLFLDCTDLHTLPAHRGVELLVRLFGDSFPDIAITEKLSVCLPGEWYRILVDAYPDSYISTAILAVRTFGNNSVAKFEKLPQLVCYLEKHGRGQPEWQPYLVQLAKSQLADTGYLPESTFDALKCLAIPLQSISTKKYVLMGDKQLFDNLAFAQLASSVETDQIFNILDSKCDYTTSLNNEERQKHSLVLKHLIGKIVPSPGTWAHAATVLEKCFLHDSQGLRIAILGCMKDYLDTIGQVEADQVGIGGMLLVMWDALREFTLRAMDRQVHLNLISVLVHPRVVNSKASTSSLEKLAVDIIDHSHSRRNLLVPLVHGLSQHHAEWVSKVLATAFTFLQTDHDSHKLEGILAEQHGVYRKSWGLPEKAARVYAFDYFSRGYDAETTSRYLMDSSRFQLFYPSKRHDGNEERVRVLCYQLLLAMEPFWSPEFAKQVLDSLKYAVDVESSPTARIYIEWIVACLLQSHPSYVKDFLFKSLKNNLQPRFVSSLGRVGLLYGKTLVRADGQKFFDDYLDLVMPLATSNRAPVRHFSVAMVYAIYADSHLRELLSPEKLKLVDGMAECAASAENFKDFKQGQECVWNIAKEYTFAGICGGVVSRVTGRVTGDYLRAKDFEQVLGPGQYGEGWNPTAAVQALNTATTIRASVHPRSANIQTKSDSSKGSECRRSGLIVVASLCDKPTNMGAICRLCDALGVGLVTFHDLTLAKNPQFRSTAVTAEKWMPMQEVTESEIEGFMMEQKKAGYTLVGLEQTDNSKILAPNLEFADKTLLLIGKEREGIPGDLLAHLDYCVEIEQLGVVRSMNIQTATAVFVHAYNHQRS